MRVLWIHGVNTPPDEPFAAVMNAVLRRAGFPVDKDEDGRWNSTGTFVGDGVFFANPMFKAESIERVAQAVLRFLAKGPGILVAHSMGTVILQEVERILMTGAPIIYMGSPLTSPYIAPALHAVGFGRPPPAGCRPANLWNVDDPIVGGHLRMPLPYVEDFEVSVDGDRFGVHQEEHDAALYAGSSIALHLFKELWQEATK